VQSERLFSASGRLIAKPQTHLLADDANCLVFLNKIIDLFCVAETVERTDDLRFSLFYLTGTVFECLTLLSLGRLLSETASSFDFGDLKTSSVGFCTGQAGCPPYFYFRFQFSPVACTRYVHSQLA